MPFPVKCPHCSASVTVPDNAAGRSGPCPRCRQVFTVPGQAPRLAPVVPVPRPQPAPDPFADFDDDPDDTGDDAGSDRGEPWYYVFVATYARVLMWMAIAMVCLFGCGCPGFSILSYLAYRPPATRGSLDIAFLLAGAVFWLLFLIAGVLAVVFNIALVLIFVDQGRNIRRMRQRKG